MGKKIDSINVKDLTVFYETEGSGEPIYLLEEGPGLTAYYMKTISAELSKKYQTVWNLKQDLEKININTLIIHGQRDPGCL